MEGLRAGFIWVGVHQIIQRTVSQRPVPLNEKSPAPIALVTGQHRAGACTILDRPIGQACSIPRQRSRRHRGPATCRDGAARWTGVTATVRCMEDQGRPREDITAVIGPCISQRGL